MQQYWSIYLFIYWFYNFYIIKQFTSFYACFILTHVIVSIYEMMWGASTLIILCLWHVKRCWLNYSIKKYNKEVRHDIIRKLGVVMYMKHLENQYLKCSKILNKCFYKYFVIIPTMWSLISILWPHEWEKMDMKSVQPLLFSYIKLINFYYVILS